MSSPAHIVLVDPVGEVLFSGESLSSRNTHPPVREAPSVAPGRGPEAESCPATLRSVVAHESGIYAATPSGGATLGPLANRPTFAVEEIRGERTRAA